MEQPLNHHICVSPDRLEKIKTEFERGFKFICEFEKIVTIFGSTHSEEASVYYGEARFLAKSLAEDGYGIVTGGGPGIMEAANRGAVEGGGRSIGITIQLPTVQKTNPYVKEEIGFYYFFSRKVILSFVAQAYIFFPGGYGTLDEFFEIITLIQTKKIHDQIPVILFGKEYWGPLYTWLEGTVLKKYNAVSENDLRIITMTDDMNEVIKIVKSTNKREHF